MKPIQDGTEAFARAREVHGTLHRLWAPTMKAAGFERASSSACAFAKERADKTGFVTLGVQISASGESWRGNRFTLNANGAATKPADYAFTVFRPLKWLDADALSLGLANERRVRARCPTPPPHHPVWTWAQEPGRAGDVFRKALAELKVVRESVWQPGYDIWLPHFGSADVQERASFLLPVLPSLLSRAELERFPRVSGGG